MAAGSITFWNRLEPRPRSGDLATTLAARVRDPAWFLARQWQLGEFQGEDAASPAYLEIYGRCAPMAAWSHAPGETPTPLDGAAPIERTVTQEGASPGDLALAVELGQTFARFLVDAGAADLRSHFLSAYPIQEATGPEEPLAARLRALWQGRAIDGCALFAASQLPPQPGQPPPGVPASVPSAQHAAAAAAVAQLAAWVTSTVGTISTDDPPAWRAPSLDYALHVYASDPASEGDTVALTASPGRDGDLAWYSLDLDPGNAPALSEQTSKITQAVIPGPVKFRGMPSERFWDFEDGRVDFGALRPDRRNLASLILTDFMLVHGNDWFLVPLEVPVGSLCSVELQMMDVFGDKTTIERADAHDPRWSMFSIANPDGSPASFVALPASAAGTVLESAPVEDVRFLRDDTANLAWAVEHATEGALGRAWLAADRAPTPAAAAPVSSAPLAYRLQTSVPAHWIPFQPVKLGAGDEIALERAALLSVSGAPTLPTPLGRVLAPSWMKPTDKYRVREEEIPREGARVMRRARRARGVDGSTHVWTARARSVGTGEGWSGLRFDLAVETVPPEES